ncbi:bifunctional P-450:NADPH-P450 reductase 1 [Streptomyces lincolnensis]|uniref:Bifunctional cytochrome P450/NADPH--P450 reductase n=1 Tax=Streptomyces lincolnensis TaxID=1915 RepID=A0A1B1MMW4_STRLN|nr:cytochrome P450 [Streptomyces lincolnensis]ANS69893.1 bifunctional P-450:NADPH-P450 reductase 1 [Streptomyces lincolnensis]AXG58811.1 bifunctional P-450:NADPH-P450 reductase 1 [Streptomyces lincolnensis]QMV11429.1 cytochrome P450 [Streptomyces lincolnensis]
MPPTAQTTPDLPDVPVVDISDTGPGCTPLQQVMGLMREHGPLLVRRLHGRDVTFVADLDLVTELADETRFAKAVGPALENVREFAADGLFTAYSEEPNWARAHDILMPAFALGSMRTYHPVMLEVARRLIGSWDRAAFAGRPVNVPDDMTRMTLDTIGLAGFGYDFGSFDRDEPHPFVESMVRCLEWAMTRLARTPGSDHTAADEAFRTDAAHLAQVVDDVINARLASGESGGDDLLGLMLTATHPADGTTLDTTNIRNQVITFLIAGHETTSGAMSFAMYYLAKHPAVLQLVRREVDELWGDTADPEPTFDEVGRLTYTRQVLNEALRLWPTAAAFSRQAREDTLLGGRIPLRAGQALTVVAPMLHRQPVWGDNPELFDPSRFTPEAEAARSPHAFKPFGTGERACIGRQFALHEATMLLALLVHRYRLHDHADYRLTVKEALTLKPDGFTLTLTPRTGADRAHPPLPGAAPLTEAAAVSDAALPARVRRGTRALFLHGSNYGTCRDFAARLADEAAAVGCETEVAPLDAYAGGLPTDRTVVITAASYNGQPTDDARQFATWLDEATDAGGVHYAVLGVGDRNWAATYQHVPTRIDERLAELGATRLLDRAAGDASGDLTGTVRAFTADLRTALLTAHGDPDAVAPAPEPETAYEVRTLTSGPLDALAERHDLVPMTVTEAYGLTAPGHPRLKRFVRLALPAGTTYRTADHVTVLPVNDKALVERAAAALGVDLDSVLDIRATRPRSDGLAVDRPLTVRQLLAHHVELLRRPSAGQRSALATANPCPPERAQLAALGDDDPRTLVELFEAYPALRGALDWPALLDLLTPLRPRHYSVSSSPATDPGHVDLMVSLLEAPARSGNGTYRGVGSGHLAGVQPGDTVLARVQPCRDAFRVDHSRPVVMIAAGTGLAPFRGAVADRVAALARGEQLPPALCYFGCDAPEADFLHAEELRAAQTAGAVRLRPAFSAVPEGEVRFVQHRVAAEADEVAELLDAGARVYVCGDGSRMAPGVREAFRTLYRERTPGADEAAAERWLDGLVRDGRYVEDVYAAG